MRREDRVEAALNALLDLFLGNAKSRELLEHLKKSLGRYIDVGLERSHACLFRSLDDVAGNDREDACPNSASAIVCDVLVDVAGICERVKALSPGVKTVAVNRGQGGTVPRFGEKLLVVPVSISAFDAVRQALGLAANERLERIPYVLRGKLSSGALGARRFTDKGTLDLSGVVR